jgi:hypothetical protein
MQVLRTGKECQKDICNMKYIQSRKQFINEAVEVKTNRYQRTHGKKPKGFGQWAFYFDDMGGEPIFVPKAMSYSDAVKWAKGEAKKAGKREIYVGESVDEAKSPVKIGDVLTHPDGRKGKVVKIMSDMANVDFGKGDVYGIMFRRIKGNQITENYDTEQRKEMASKGLALPDGSFPIKTVEDLKNAILAYGRAKDQSAAAKFIAKRAKALNADDLIPDTEDFQKALKEAEFGRIPKFGE